jgi:hypothetical protein
VRDRGIIYAGLGIFLVLATFPAWYNLAGRATIKGPALARAQGKQCVAAVAYMRSNHMSLLAEWRDEVVRRGGRGYTAGDGQRYRMSLTSTCLGQCHGSKDEFCDRCHLYAAVSPTCWSCHLDSKAGPDGSLRAASGRGIGGGR